MEFTSIYTETNISRACKQRTAGSEYILLLWNQAVGSRSHLVHVHPGIPLWVNRPYLCAGRGHPGDVGVLQLINGAELLEGQSIVLLVHSLHLQRTHTAPTVPLQTP